MIDLLFRQGTEYVIIRINGTNLLFGSTSYGNQLVPLKNLRLSEQGILKEHPDLKGNPQMKTIAMQRFFTKLKKFKTEREREQYIIQDLSNHGFEIKKRQVAGGRMENVQ